MPTAFLVILCLSLFIGITATQAMRRYYRDAKSSAHWLRVDGTLTKCAIVEQHDEGKVFNLDVRYSYEMGEQKYESSEIMFYCPKWSSSRAYYEQLQRRIEGNEPLRVYVNPDKFEQSVLVPGPEQCPRAVLWIAGLMFFFCPAAGFTAFYVLLIRPWFVGP
jgi:hypothetical protein